MAANAELGLLFTATDKASAVIRGAVGLIGGALVSALADAARAAAEDEANTVKLQQAIENSGASYDAYADQIDAAIKKGQDLAFADSDTRDSIAQLTEATGDAQKAIDLQGVAMDIARAKHISLASATDIVQKAALGQTGALKKMGIVLADGATATEALAALQQKFGGQAEAYGKTTEAAIFRVKDAIGEWMEGIGAAMGPAQGIIALLPGMQSGFALVTSAGGALSALIKGPMISSFLATIPATIAMMAPFLPLIIVIGLIGAAILLLKLAWENNWGDIQGKTKAVFDFLGGLFDGFIRFMANFGLMLIGLVRGAIGVVTGILNGLIDGWNAVAEHLGLPILGHIKVDTPGLDAVEAALNTAARPRTSSITVYETVVSAAGHGGRAYAEGTPYVPYTGPAIVHRGEAIIPADRNPFTGATGGGAMTVHVEVHGSVIGVQDLRQEVLSAVKEGVRAGGLRGVMTVAPR